MHQPMAVLRLLPHPPLAPSRLREKRDAAMSAGAWVRACEAIVRHARRLLRHISGSPALPTSRAPPMTGRARWLGDRRERREVRRRSGQAGRSGRSPRRDAGREILPNGARSRHRRAWCARIGGGCSKGGRATARPRREPDDLRLVLDQPPADHSGKRVAEEQQKFGAVTPVEALLATLAKRDQSAW